MRKTFWITSLFVALLGCNQQQIPAYASSNFELVKLVDDQILFAGDPVFYEMHPYMGQGIPDDWVGYLEYMETLDINRLVPGHGEVCGREAISAMKACIHSMDSLASVMLGQDMGIERVQEILIPEPYKSCWFDNFFVLNLRFMYGIRISQNQF